jgi:type II secretory pathway pseudopilin PulG
VEPSSLVLVAIIGVWAAYLVPHWLRRRDELAQSRAGDRFSDRLRVLNRRRRSSNAGHRSGDAVLTSPRVVVDSDGEFLYIPADRTLAAAASAAAVVEPVVASAAVPADRAVTHTSPSSPARVRRAPVSSSPVPARPAPMEEPSVAEAEPVHERPYDLDVAIACARIAARRRAVIMALLLVASVSSWGVSTVASVPTWVALPATVLLVLHALASRSAGLRSRESLTVLAAQLHSAELAQARPQRQVAVTARPADVAVVAAAAQLPERVVRRAAAVGAETWEPVPVPPPTYTLKPAVHRPEPAPLELPAAHAPAAAAQTGAPAVPRGALPRRAADVERILALESDVDELFQHRAG